MIKVFLGGTCNESPWRDELIPMLEKNGIDYFNPVVDDWTEECQKEEIRQREICDFVLYTITPKMTGVYSIAEVVDDSNKRPEKTLFCLLDKDIHNGYQIEFNKSSLKSLLSVEKMVMNNGGRVFHSLEGVSNYLKGKK